jgi:hypothetical protein
LSNADEKVALVAVEEGEDCGDGADEEDRSIETSSRLQGRQHSGVLE